MHLMILKSVVPTVSSLRGYYYTYLLKFSYPYILHILVRCSGKSILSSVDIGVSRIEGIERLFGKNTTTEYGSSAPMIHGALYF